MPFCSTRNTGLRVVLKDAVLQGLSPDGGLYMPVDVPPLKKKFLETLPGRSFQEIALEVARNLLHDESIDPEILQEIIRHSLSFDAPLVPIDGKIFSLELFHGPTFAFKDFGARFMARLISHYALELDREITILVATSGDTGSAVASGFFGVPGVRVIVLYPSGKISAAQEKQITTLGGNVTAVEVEGVFDDCQRLVKEAFSDPAVRQALMITSANSINVARLIPQTFYYFYAVAQVKSDLPVIFSVPSGNFGNLTAGLLARRMGLRVSHFVAATNANDIVPSYLQTGVFTPRPSRETISNAMDVGNPSNFERIMHLYGHDQKALCKDVAGYAFSDDETRDAIRSVSRAHGYVLDPHGAVGYLGIRRYVHMHRDVVGIFLETAHPGKFHDIVEPSVGRAIEVPAALRAAAGKPGHRVPMDTRYASFRKLLLS